MSFPSFNNKEWRFPKPDDPGDGPCQVPDPIMIDPQTAEVDTEMERIESALVRVENMTIGAFFGPEPATGSFDANKSNCDLDGNGDIDFESPNSNEAACANLCGDNPQCVEWSGFAARGNYRVILPGNKSIQVNTGSIPRSIFDPVAMRGKPIQFLTGTLRNFSGGALNWTVEARCAADVVCDDPSQPQCVDGPDSPVPSDTACVFPRTDDDPNENTN